jgi:hypothetical protein
MYSYTAFNLGIYSEIPIPELIPADLPPDVILRLGPLADSSQNHDHQGSCFKGKIEGIGTFLIQNGQEIIIDPLPNVDLALLRTVLLGPVLCVLLRQRGLLVLHASSVAIQGFAIAFLAASGWGKSTLAEAFYSKGYSILTDDVMALQMSQDIPLVLPSLPQIKLWPESAIFAGHTLETLPHIYQQTEKRSHRLRQGFLHTPLPLKRLYVLADGPHHAITLLSRQQAFVELVRHSRAITLLNSPDFQTSHLQNCTNLIQQISICRLQRFRSLDVLSDLVSLVESDIAENNIPALSTST